MSAVFERYLSTICPKCGSLMKMEYTSRTRLRLTCLKCGYSHEVEVFDEVLDEGVMHA